MKLTAILGDDVAERAEELARAVAMPEYLRSAFAAKLVTLAKEAVTALAGAEEDGEVTDALVTDVERVCLALAALDVAVAKSFLFRIADEGTTAVKVALARALRSAATASARAVLVYLLSDDDARSAAIQAIEEAPWPEVLPDLIEIAEADDRTAQLTLRAIAKCGAIAGPAETNAAADFLVEQLDDEASLPSAVDALLRFGAGFPCVAAKAALLVKDRGARRIAGLCLLAAIAEDEGRAVELDAAQADAAAAQSLLAPLLDDPHARVRAAARRIWTAIVPR